MSSSTRFSYHRIQTKTYCHNGCVTSWRFLNSPKEHVTTWGHSGLPAAYVSSRIYLASPQSRIRRLQVNIVVYETWKCLLFSILLLLLILEMDMCKMETVNWLISSAPVSFCVRYAPFSRARWYCQSCHVYRSPESRSGLSLHSCTASPSASTQIYGGGRKRWRDRRRDRRRGVCGCVSAEAVRLGAAIVFPWAKQAFINLR